MERKVHDLVQGSPEWDQFRLEHHGASEAAAMLGLSKKTSRTELLRMKKTGVAKVFSDYVQENILDRGHAVEALARPIIEKLIGETLYPATYSYGKLSASCDGLTMGVEIAFEHKQPNKELVAAVKRKELPEEHIPQNQQILLVTGAEKVIFTVSDGTEENLVSMEVFPDPVWQERIIAGWKQFDIDFENFVPPEVIPAAVAAPIVALPTVSIKVEGSVALVSNLPQFGRELNAFIEGIPKNPETDQDFANCKAAVKILQEAQDALDAAEAHAMGQVASFDEMKRIKATLFNLARDTRLAVDRLVVARERQIKEEIVASGKSAFAAHIDSLNKRLGKPYMPTVPADFAGAIKNKRTIASLKDAVDTELSRAKIEANAIADKLQINLATLTELASDYKGLFADTAQIIHKANDDLTVLIKSRIAEHTAAEQKKADELREKIRLEEEAKANAKAQEAIAAAAKPAQVASTTAVQPLPLATTVQAPAVTPAIATPKPKLVAGTAGPRPTDDNIILILSQHYKVNTSIVIGWLETMNLKGAAARHAELLMA